MSKHTPSASELFTTVWHNAMCEDGAVRPGSHEWGPKQINRWLQVWIDCSNLEDKLEALEAGADTLEMAEHPERFAVTEDEESET